MHKLKAIRECLVETVECQLEHMECVDTHELGEVIDMIKDLEQAMYYHVMSHPMAAATMEKEDCHEGRSVKTRRKYMEAKEAHKDKAVKVQELEQYMKELSEDITEMIEGASAEEKTILEKKVTALASKVATLNA